MSFLNVSLKGLNGRVHPALAGIFTTKCVAKSRDHIKMLTDDLYTYDKKARYQGGSPQCRLCSEQHVEDLVHIVATCKTYQNCRLRILFQMEIICRHAKSRINFRTIQQNPNQLTQFILDCTSINLENRISEYDEICPLIFNLARDLCHGIIRTRDSQLKLLKL